MLCFRIESCLWYISQWIELSGIAVRDSKTDAASIKVKDHKSSACNDNESRY